MKKLFALALGCAFLAILPGCVYMDHPRVTHGDIWCDTCPNYDQLGARLLNLSMMTAGTSPFDNEKGEYIGTVVNITPATQVEVCDWFGGGGGAGNQSLLHTYRNAAAGDAVGCQIGWDCYSGALLDWGWLWCPPDRPVAQMCNEPNGDCNPPFWAGPYTQWPAGSIPSELYYICIDNTPGAPGEGGTNLVRAPGGLCPDCAMAMADDDVDGVSYADGKTCDKEGKVLICHYPPGNPDNRHEICVSESAIPAHMAHGDSMGLCEGGGGPGGGPHIEVPAGNNAPAWVLGYMLYIDFTFEDMADGVPWTDDYTSYGGTINEGGADLLTDLLRYHPTDEDGNIKLGIRSLKYGRDSIELEPPVVGHIKLQWTDNGLGHMGAMKAGQPAAPELLQFLIDVTDHGKPVDFRKIEIVTNNGMVIDGSDLKALFWPNGDIALGHDRLKLAIKQQEAFALSAGADTRVRTVR